MNTTATLVKTANSARTADEVLRGPIGALLGVSDDAVAALGSINIQTVFDLAASRIFAAASDLVAISAGNTQRIENRLNIVPSDAIDAPAGVPVAELARQPISILRSIGAAAAATIIAALDTPTVRDLALWPPYRAAKVILAEAFFPEQQSGFDLDAPVDLLPQSGVYPTERVFYRRLLIDASPTDGPNIPPIENLSEAIDILPGLLRPTGFEKLATGARLTFSQSWFSQGMTLGQLLHSTSLAPGESTRLAVIDWSRRSRAATTEQVSEAEQLSEVATHNRALSEVTSATATEIQSGSSSSTVNSGTAEAGTGFGFDLGPLAFGGSSGASTTTTDAVSASSSFGLRNVAADYAQNINDRTQQNATSARDRRASTVREVSQEEHETISTRVLTNYNHMHALSVQYYEVVQAFRITTQLERVERCLFFPVKLVDFSNRATIERWRAQLGRAALTAAAGRMLAEFGTVLATSQLPLRIPIRPVSVLGGLSVGFLTARILNTTPPAATAAKDATGVSETIATSTVSDTAAVPADSIAAKPQIPTTRIGRMAAAGWDFTQLEKLGRLSGRLLLPTRTNSVYISDDALLVGVSLRAGAATQFQLKRLDGTLIATQDESSGGVSLIAPVAISEMKSISIANAAASELTTSLILQLSLFGTITTLDVPIDLPAGGTISGLRECVTFDAGAAMRELIDHLQANALHYTQAILRALEGPAIAALLAGFSYRGLPLAQLVDQQPVAVTANFLVFKMNMPATGDAPDPALKNDFVAWQQFLSRTGLDRPVPRSEIVPLPSGGVFGEAVLGRFNSAERLDLTRFWNWQDSPIPLSPPEIAAVTSESRSQPEAAKPGQLSAPVVNIQTPTALPDPTSMAAIVAAIQNGNMFRDMSGLAQTAALAQAAQKSSAAGATSAMQQAGQNLQTVMDEKTQRMRIAAQLIAQLYGIPVSGDTGSQSPPGKDTPTERGGEINEAKNLDAQKPAGTTSGAPGSSAEADTFRAQQGTTAQKLVDQITNAATAPEVDAISGAAQQTPTRTVGPVTSVPDSILAVLNLSGLFTDPSVFGPTPVKIDASIQDRGGKKIWQRTGTAAPTFSGSLKTTDTQLFLNMFYQYDLSWPQPTTIVTNNFVNLTVPAGAMRIDVVAWVFVDTKTVTSPVAINVDADVALFLSGNGVDVRKVLAKPTQTARSDGGFDVTAKVLRVTMEQLSSPAAPT